VIGGTNEVGQELSIDLVANGLENIDPNNIIWYRGTTQVGTGATYTVEAGDAGKEIIAKLIVSGQTLATGSGGSVPNPTTLASGEIDTSFNIGTGFSLNPSSTFMTLGKTITNSINTIEVYNNKILLGGWFNLYNGQTKSHIIRLNNDGTEDTSFNVGSGFNQAVNILKYFSDGKIIAGGFFTNYNGTPSNRIIKLNSDGSIDNTFQIGTGFNNSVNSFNIQTQDKLLVGGRFSTYNGILSLNRLVRLGL